MNWKVKIPAATLLIMVVLAGAVLLGGDSIRTEVRAQTRTASNGGANHPPANPIAQESPVATPQTQELSLRDVAAEVGLDFQHGAFRESVAEDPAAMMGGGLCWLDYDQDGWLDLYVVNSHANHELELWEDAGGLPHNTLFRNQGDGTFEDVSAGSGADLAMRGNGCVAGDIDGNGYPDLYVTADGVNALLLNGGDGTFTDVAREAGVDAPEWNSAAALADMDNDGLIDIFVGAYIDLEKTVPDPIGLFPQDYLGLPNRLYRNQGDGTFEEISTPAGLTDEERTLGAIFSDVDGDGYLDLYVANDGEPNRLYHNEGDGTFVDITETASVGDRHSGMGVSAGDYTGDGRIDLVVTNFGAEYNALYRNQGVEDGMPLFDYSSFRMGLQGFGRDQTGWGVTWLDLDLDGDLDLFTAQGKVPVTDLEADRELVRYYRNSSDGTFLDMSRAVGQQEIGPLLARGSAVADYDNDGSLDLAISTIGGPLVLLESSGAMGNWLLVELPRFLPGAHLQATLDDGRVLVRELYSGSSYLASEDPRFHLGVGDAESIPELALTLPDGQELVYEDVPANQIFQVPAGDLPASATMASSESAMMPSAEPTMVPSSDDAMMPPEEVQATMDEEMPRSDVYAPLDEYGSALSRDWMQLIYDRVQADRISPPAAARIFAYVGVTFYEAVLPGTSGYRSLQTQLNEMPELPQPQGGPYNWAAVATSAVATVADGLFETAESREQIASLRDGKLAALTGAGIAPDVMARSQAHGRRLGQVILAWAWTDGYLLIKDRAYTMPEEDGYWVPTGTANGGLPLEPYWSELRPFTLTAADVCEPPDHLPFSSEPDSAFFIEAQAVYDADRALTEDQRDIARFWADNPGETGTPPGHWVSIANQVLEAEGLSLAEAAEVHALLGVALADAFISCWEEKYDALLVRPVTYIQTHIDAGWEPLVATPPFPEYTSGHSVASAAAAAVLTDLLGDLSFTDNTHVAWGLAPRSYDSFMDAADEAAISRLYGGIHYPMAIDNGLGQGQCIGRIVLERVQTR